MVISSLSLWNGNQRNMRDPSENFSFRHKNSTVYNMKKQSIFFWSLDIFKVCMQWWDVSTKQIPNIYFPELRNGQTRLPPPADTHSSFGIVYANVTSARSVAFMQTWQRGPFRENWRGRCRIRFRHVGSSQTNQPCREKREHFSPLTTSTGTNKNPFIIRIRSGQSNLP